MSKGILKKVLISVSVVAACISASAMAATKVTDTMWYRVNGDHYEASSWGEICKEYAEKYFLQGVTCTADGITCRTFAGTVIRAVGSSIVCLGVNSQGKEYNYSVGTVFCKQGKPADTGQVIEEFGCFE